jgi:hypothetical protein
MKTMEIYLSVQFPSIRKRTSGSSSRLWFSLHSNPKPSTKNNQETAPGAGRSLQGFARFPWLNFALAWHSETLIFSDLMECEIIATMYFYIKRKYHCFRE